MEVKTSVTDQWFYSSTHPTNMCGERNPGVGGKGKFRVMWLEVLFVTPAAAALSPPLSLASRKLTGNALPRSRLLWAN